MKNKHLKTTSIVLFVMAQLTSFGLLALFILRLFSIRGGAEAQLPLGTGLLLLIGGCLLYVAVTVALSIIFKNLSSQIRLTDMYDTFIANITHELKTPLASIQLYLETLKKRRVPEEKRREFIELMLSDALRLKNLIDAILKVAVLEQKRDLFEYRRCRFDDTISRLVEKARKQFKLPVEAVTVSGSAPCEVVVDENALEIVFSNLIDNAVKYSPPPPYIEVVLACNGRRARAEVRDQGIGIAPKEQKRIFQKFYRVADGRAPNVKGTGLGLYWVREIIRQHGGRISVFSEGHGKGSTFRIELPVYPVSKARYLNRLLSRRRRKERQEAEDGTQPV